MMKRLILIVLTGVAIAGVAVFQLTPGGSINAPHGVLTYSSGGSVGPTYEVNVADGNGGWLDANCNIIPAVGPDVNCPALTYNTTRTITDGTHTCPLFPDQFFINQPANTYPIDPFSSQYIANYTLTQPTITAATWVGGTATITLSGTPQPTTGGQYGISGAVSSNCVSGGDCGFNSQAATLGGTGSYYTLTSIGSNQFTYPLTANPGTWSSGGIVLVPQNIPGQSSYLGRFSAIGSMAINMATNSTTVPTMVWGATGGPGGIDGGAYPVLPTFLVEGYTWSGGSYVPQTVSITTTLAGDQHLLSVNLQTCTMYEMDGFYLNSGADTALWGTIWNLYSGDLRSKHKVGPQPDGLNGSDVAGLPIWPLTLQYTEVFSGSPITHAIRFTMPTGGFYNGCNWPATHFCNQNAPGVQMPLGSRWIMNASFDTTTCHRWDCAGLAWPAYMQRLFTALQTYGMVFSDGGVGVGMIVDSNPSWGDPSNGSSPYTMTNEWTHGITFQDGYFVDPMGHVVSVDSGLVH